MISKELIKKGILGVVILAAGAGIFAYTSKPASYRCGALQKGSVISSVKESGEIKGEDTVTYFAGVSAPVADISIETGDLVKKGDLLLRYNTEDYEYALLQANLAKEQAIADAEGQIKRSDDNLSRYKSAVAQDATYAQLYAVSREQANAISESQYTEDYYISCDANGLNTKIAELKRDLSQVERDLSDQQNKIANAGVNATKSMKKKRNELKDQAEAITDEIADLNVQLSRTHIDGYTPEENALRNDTANVMEDLNRNWQQAQTNKLTYENSYLNDEQKEALHKGADRAAEEANQAQLDLTKAQNGVTAEFDGVVTECNIKKDAVVAEGTPLFSVESRENVKAVVKISRYDIQRIKVGQKAVINVAGLKYDGEVSKITQLAATDTDDKSKISVEVHVLNPDEALILGVEADVTITTDNADNALLLPYDAYYIDDEGSYCYCITNGIVEKKYFTAGIVGEDYVEVQGGLDGNENVVIDAITEDAIGKKANSL